MVRALYNGIKRVPRLRDVLGARVRQEMFARGDGAQVSRVIALKAAHEAVRQPTRQIWVFAIRLLRHSAFTILQR